MIYFDEQSRRFELQTKRSCYIMEIDEEGRLNFVAWGKRLASQEGPINVKLGSPGVNRTPSHETFKCIDEISAWGDECLGELGLDVVISSVKLQLSKEDHDKRTTTF